MIKMLMDRTKILTGVSETVETSLVVLARGDVGLNVAQVVGHACASGKDV